MKALNQYLSLVKKIIFDKLKQKPWMFLNKYNKYTASVYTHGPVTGHFSLRVLLILLLLVLSAV